MQRDIYKWSSMQAEHVPHIKWACNADDYSFSIIHSGPSPMVTGFSVVTNPTANNDIMDMNNFKSVNLWTPSDVPTAVRHLVVSMELITAKMELITAKMELLQAKLHDCLVSVRRFCRLHTVVCSNITGNWSAGADSAEQKKRRKQISDIGTKIESAKICYQRAWRAADRLEPGGLGQSSTDGSTPVIFEDQTYLTISPILRLPHAASNRRSIWGKGLTICHGSGGP
jgi:hypothetical protein